MLKTVTITGADDGVDPEELVRLSAEYPFVEWGILYSASRCGGPRYPTEPWRLRLTLAVQQAQHPVRLSAHFCGEYTTAVLAGRPLHLEALSRHYARVQLNGFSRTDAFLAMARKYQEHWAVEWILQARAYGSFVDAGRVARLMTPCRAGVLWDVSGGRGMRPESYPEPPADVPIGYAGGFNPDNLMTILPTINWTQDYWIDMESGVRDGDGDQWSLPKVRSVLEQASAFRGIAS